MTEPDARPKADDVCGWCHIRLRAVPDEPVTFLGARYHPACARTVRILGEHRRRT